MENVHHILGGVWVVMWLGETDALTLNIKHVT